MRVYLKGKPYIESVRLLSDLEKQLMPTFVKLRWIWDIGDILSFMPLWGERPSDEYLAECVGRLHELMEGEADSKAGK